MAANEQRSAVPAVQDRGFIREALAIEFDFSLLGERLMVGKSQYAAGGSRTVRALDSNDTQCL
jgi:hypothetical protein